jgi:hypothetical protein
LKPLILRCLLTRLEERQVGVREIVDDDQAVLLGSDVLHGLVGVLVLSLGEAHDFIGDLTDVFRRDAPELIDEVPERRRAGAVEAREIVCQIFQPAVVLPIVTVVTVFHCVKASETSFRV